MNKIICAIALAMLSACGTTATSNAAIDPSLAAPPACQPSNGLSGCYAGNGGGGE